MLRALILFISGGTYSLKTTPNDRFFEKLFMAVFITLRVFARNLLRGNRRRSNFWIFFRRISWGSNPGFTSYKSPHYLLDYSITQILIVTYTIGHYNFLIRIMTYVLTSFMLCASFLYFIGETYSLKSTTKNII